MSTRSSPPRPTSARRCSRRASRAPISTPTASPSSSTRRCSRTRCRPSSTRARRGSRVGLGTIARVVATGEEIYAAQAALRRGRWRGSSALYRPYHAPCASWSTATRGALRRAICCSTAIRCPRRRADRARRRGAAAPTSCWATATARPAHPLIVETAQRDPDAPRAIAVARNTPYAGGFTTAHYGNPAPAATACRSRSAAALYMDERNFDRKPFLAQLTEDMRDLAAALADIDPALLAPPHERARRGVYHPRRGG